MIQQLRRRIASGQLPQRARNSLPVIDFPPTASTRSPSARPSGFSNATALWNSAGARGHLSARGAERFPSPNNKNSYNPPSSRSSAKPCISASAKPNSNASSNKPMQTNMSDTVIETSHVSRAFGGVTALRDFTLSVPRGSIYGFLGRNGSGKTTAIKMLMASSVPAAADTRVLGRNPFDCHRDRSKKIGYLSEKQILPGNFQVGRLIKFCAQFYPLWNARPRGKLIHLSHRPRAKNLRSLAGHTAIKVTFIITLGQRPELLILANPPPPSMSSRAAELWMKYSTSSGRMAATVFISSHLSDAERVSTDRHPRRRCAQNQRAS